MVKESLRPTLRALYKSTITDCEITTAPVDRMMMWKDTTSNVVTPSWFTGWNFALRFAIARPAGQEMQ